MKKILLFVVGIFSMFAITNTVLAADFGTSISGSSEIQAGGQFTLTFKITNGTNIWGATAKLNYDSSKLTLVSSSAGSGFALTLGSNIVIDAAAGKSGTFTMCTITFKATSAFAVGQSTTVSLSNVNGSNGESDLSGSNSSKSIKVVPPKSTNNYLSSLSVTPGTISFSKTDTSYKITVNNDVTKVTIAGATEDAKAKLSGTGTKSLKVYNNTFKVVVTSESGAKRTYTIVVVRKDAEGNTAKVSSDTSLSTLKVAGYTLDFNKSTLEYTIEVENDVEELNIEALANAKDATVKIDKPEKLVVGENTYTVTVTSKSGDVLTYTIKVNKKEKQIEEKPVIEPAEKEETKDNNLNIKSIVIICLSVILVASIVVNIILYKRIKK